MVLLFALGAAAALILGSRRTGWFVPAAWLALLIAGFGAALHLIHAPPVVAYQHYRLRAEGPLDVVAWLVLLTQGLLIATLGRAHVAAALRAARRHPVPAALLAAALLITSVAPSRNPAVWLPEMLLATVLQFLAITTLVAAARTVSERNDDALSAVIARVLGPAGGEPVARLDRWVLAVAAGTVVVSATLAWAVYQRHPHVPDEVPYLLQARYFAAGQLWMPPPPVPAAFHLDLMHYEPSRWYSPVPPGWPAVLAVGARVGVAWLVNPLLGGVAILLAYLVLGGMYERRTARLATVLLAASPWFLFMSMNLMTHTLSLVAALAAALGVARARASGGSLAAFGGGLGIGVVSLVRPLEGVAVAALLGLWSLGARGRRLRFAPSASLVAGTVIAGALAFPYNAALTGSPLAFPINSYVEKYYGPGANDLGFGPNRGIAFGGNDPFPGHGAPDVAVNTIFNTFQINVELLGWPIAALVLLWVAVARPWRDVARADRWQLAVIAVVVGIHGLYWFSGGPDFGARYWYLVIVPCVALVARGLGRVRLDGPSGGNGGSDRAAAAALALVAFAVLLYVPWRALGKYWHYRGMRADVPVLAEASGFGRGLVLIRGRRFPDYASAATYNPVDLQSGTVYAWDASLDVRERVIRHFADRPVWFVDGPSITGAGYRVVEGPVTAEQALALSPRIGVNPAGDSARAYDPVNPPRPKTP